MGGIDDILFQKASKIKLYFGRYKGESLVDIAGQLGGLSYLYWLVDQDFVRNPLREMLEIFLANPDIKTRTDIDIDESREEYFSNFN